MAVSNSPPNLTIINAEGERSMPETTKAGGGKTLKLRHGFPPRAATTCHEIECYVEDSIWHNQTDLIL